MLFPGIEIDPPAGAAATAAAAAARRTSLARRAETTLKNASAEGAVDAAAKIDIIDHFDIIIRMAQDER